MQGSKAISVLQGLVTRMNAEAATAHEIERLLSGESDGGILFQVLYGDVVDEPVPDRLLAVLREAEEEAA